MTCQSGTVKAHIDVDVDIDIDIDKDIDKDKDKDGYMWRRQALDAGIEPRALEF